MDRGTEQQAQDTSQASMITIAELIEMDPGSCRMVAECPGGRVYWISGVNRYLVELCEPVQIGKVRNEEEIVPSREVWCDSLVFVMDHVGGFSSSDGDRTITSLPEDGEQLALGFWIDRIR